MHEIEREHLDRIKRQDVDQVLQTYARLLGEFDVEFLVLFGSRARGDHSVDSDVDIAMVLSSVSSVRKASRDQYSRLVTVAWDLELETGLSFNPILIPLAEYNDPSLFTNPRLIENIKREGKVFWTKPLPMDDDPHVDDPTP